jgi:hypothetical protein
MNIIFQINGGIGKCILATSMLESFKAQYPDSQLIIVSGYPEVFLNNPFVYRSFAFGQVQYFYQDYVENKEFKVFAHDPYLETAHLTQSEHLSKTWSELYKIPVPLNNTPQLFLTERERIFFSQKFQSDKPIMLLQTNGGAANQELKYSWARDIPMNVVQSVIEEFKNQYTIVHMRREDQISYDDTVAVTDNFRSLLVLIELSEKRLMMDSFGQHAAAGLNKPATVLWIVNSPTVFGYNIHDNIIHNPFTKSSELRNSYLQKFDIIGNLLEFPYNSEVEIFNVDQVISSLKNQKNG